MPKSSKILNSALVEVKDHAEFSASGSARWLNCPGSISLSKKAPPLRESEAAAEGTLAHACLEFLLRNRSKLEAAKVAAVNLFNAEMIEHALSAVSYIEDRLAEAGPGANLLIETKIDASRFTCSGQFGTLDVAIVDIFGRLIVLDYKYGVMAVDPEGDTGRGNSQLVYYALGLSYLYDHNFADVELVVIQPRSFHASGDTVRSHVMTVDELTAWHDVFREGVMATSDPKAPLVAGKWCKFCQGATICPKLKEEAMAKASVTFSDHNPGAMTLPKDFRTLPKLGELLGACEKLEAWISKVRQHAFLVLERGGHIDGYKLVQRKSPRKWTDKLSVEMEARKLWPKLAFTEPKLLSPAQLEKVVKGSKTWVSQRTVSESSGVTIVASTDKRGDVGRAAMFDTPVTDLDIEQYL